MRWRVVLLVSVSCAGAIGGIFPPLLTQKIFDDALFAPGGPNMGLLATLVCLVVAIYLAASILGVAQASIAARIGSSVVEALRTQMFAKLHSMEYGFFTRTRAGEIQSRLMNDIGGMSYVLSGTVPSLVGNTVVVISALVAMFVLSWQLSLLFLILLPLIVLVERNMAPRRLDLARDAQQSLAELSSISQESLSVSGILLSRSFNRHAYEIQRFATESRAQQALDVRQQMSGQWFIAVISLVFSAIPVLVYAAAGMLLNADVTGITAGTLVAFTTAQARVTGPILGFTTMAISVQASRAMLERVFEYLDLEPESGTSRNSPTPGSAALQSSGQKDPPLIKFTSVSFAYPGAGQQEPPAVQDVSFEIAAGQHAAFIGPSGSGKSTIALLIPRLFDATSGRVEFQGVDVRDLTRESLFDRVGLVSQETFLFHASIADNLRYANAQATDRQLHDAAKQAGIHDTIAALPEGYETVVGERGLRLSGGERQRVAIARVLLKDPQLLILDEATSALDSTTERGVQEVIRESSRGRTTISIAHRLRTVRDADIIFLIDGGRIAAHGTHDHLLEKSPAYAQLARDDRGATAAA